MTLPNERTRAVLWAGEFLRRLVSPYGKDGIKKIPKELRKQALAILRHYPLPTDLMYAERSFDAATVEAFLAQRDAEGEQV